MIKAIFHPSPSNSETNPMLDLRALDRALGPWGGFDAMLDEPGFWLAVAAGALTVILGIALIIRARRDAQRCGATHRRLARTLGFSRREARLLDRIARASGMAAPATLLISRGCFERAVKHGAARQHVSKTSLAQIERRLFA